MQNTLVLHILVGLIVGILSTRQIDWCSLCDRPGAHIACNNDGQWHSSCPDDAEFVNIDDTLIDALVSAHNEKRDFIAGGDDPKLSPACRMATIQWDEELAYLARLNVLQCDMEHDECHDTERFPYSGQNLGWIGQSTSFDGDFNKPLLNIVDSWFDERKDVCQEYIDAYPSNYRGPAIGHFTALVNEKNVRVGCAASTYTDGSWNNLLVACNYATTNIIDQPVYTSCDSPAENCQTGRNSNFPNLCSEEEQYDLNAK